MLRHADEGPRLSSLSRFAPPLERQFNQSYFERMVGTMRVAAPVMIALLLLGLRLSISTSSPHDLAIAAPQMAFWVAVFALSYIPRFWRVWQPVLVLLALLTSLVVLLQLAPALLGPVISPADGPPAGAITPNSASGAALGTGPTLVQQKFQFALQFVVFLVSLAMLRLSFTWSAFMYGGAVALAGWTFKTYFPIGRDVLLDLHFVFLPALLVFFPLLFMAFFQEHVSRSAFWYAHQLELERNDERRKHKQTEGQLHVLAQAIGGIVHDLGNPLASVQMGSETLEIFLEDETPDKSLLIQFAHSIHEGAEMLNFLRLSLIEQTRVLEGKPTPVSPKPVTLLSILRRSVRFQKSHVVAKRGVLLQEGDELLRADEMKMVTVWMNLIGNALKYSDGDVRVRWSEFATPAGNHLLVAVADRGMNGRGISRTNAAQLFSAFARLEAHSQIEGIGLGLLSVQKIMEAHGGQVWIEGFEDGTPGAARFSTAQGQFPSLLQDDDRTAFVVLCPLVARTS